MATIFIVHGTYGYPTENWIPWLRQELEQQGHMVIVPQFPTPENQNLDAWLTVFEQYRDQLGSDAVLIGHSVGASFLLSALETLTQPVLATALVAGFATLPADVGNIALLLQTFTGRDFDWEAIRSNAGKITVFHADNDPYVPVDKAGELARNLHVSITYVSGAGHFNEAAGYTKFPQLLEKVLQAIK